jgi:hypothetical protein
VRGRRARHPHAQWGRRPARGTAHRGTEPEPEPERLARQRAQRGTEPGAWRATTPSEAAAGPALARHDARVRTGKRHGCDERL